MTKKFHITIEFTGKKEKSFSTEVRACGIRWAIENACKEMKEAWPFFVEGVDFSIVEICELFDCRK